MRLNQIKILLPFFMLLGVVGCGQDSRNVAFFKDTEAYELAKAVEKEDLKEIEILIKENPKLLDITNPVSGSNILALCLYVEKFESFKKLLELGANPNFINPYTKYSILIDACKPFGSSLEWIKDNRYVELLLQYGANPNYAVQEEFTNEKGIHISATSPLIRASSLDLNLVKLLIKNKADYKKRVRGESPFAQAIFSAKSDMIYYYIDTLKVDIHEPMRIRDSDSLFIQDYIKKFMAYQEDSEGYNQKQKLIKYLESKGVDFRNYIYKL